MRSHFDGVADWAWLAEKAGYSVKVLALELGVSPRQLLRFFLKRTGLGPGEWMLRLRQMKALELMRNGCSGKEAALVLGFKDSAHFSHQFKRFHGFTPGQVRLLVASLRMSELDNIPLFQNSGRCGVVKTDTMLEERG